MFAVLDGAAAPDPLLPRLTDAGCDFRCLLKAQLPERLARAAPYVVALERHHVLTDWLLGPAWGESLGVYAWADASLVDVWRHLRTFLRVAVEDGRTMHFRYYDPRVLRAYLPTCTGPELALVFGPLEGWAVESGEDWLVHRRAGDGLLRERAGLPPALADLEPSVVVFLAEHYAAPRAADALWSAAAAPAPTPSRAGSPLERWRAAWSRLDDERHEVALLREALRDFPGASPLLIELERLAARDGAGLARARDLVNDVLLADDALGARSALREADVPYACLVAAFAERGDDLGPVAARLDCLRATEQARLDLHALAQRLRGAAEDDAAASAVEVDRALEVLSRDAQRGPGRDLLREHERTIATRRARLRGRTGQDLRTLRAAVASLQVSLGLRDSPAASLAARASLALEALLGARPLHASHTVAPGATDQPADQRSAERV